MSSLFTSLPSENALNFYKYFSYFTFSLSWLIAPFVFYVILTQSNDLKTFKLLILNHFFWCLTFQTFLALTMPVILSPALVGYPIGWLLKNGSPQFCAISIMFVVMLLILCIASSFATFLCRYMLVFPFGITRYLSRRIFITLSIIGATIMQLILIIGSINIVKIDKSNIQTWAEESNDPILINFLITQSAFIIIPLSLVELPLLISIITDSLIIFSAIIISAYFIYLLTTLKIQSANLNLKRSLLLSGIVQMLLVFLFLFFPTFLLIIFIRFQYYNTANTVCSLFCVVLSHSFIEFISTLLLVAPYRRFVKSLYFNNFLCCRKSNSAVNVISIIPSLEIRINNNNRL